MNKMLCDLVCKCEREILSIKNFQLFSVLITLEIVVERISRQRRKLRHGHKRAPGEGCANLQPLEMKTAKTETFATAQGGVLRTTIP